MFVQPEAGDAPYAQVIASATRTVRVWGYLMGTGGVLDALRASAKAGVDVRVILDGETQRDVNEKYRVQLEEAGAKVQWSDPAFSYMHAKSIVADESRAVVSTGNYSQYFIAKERNYLAVDSDPEDVADLVALFDADWNHARPDLSCTRLLVSPVNAKGRILALVAGAQTSLDVESMQLADDDVRKAVLARAKQGVAVRVLLASPSWIDANQQAAAELGAAGVPVRWLSSPSVHAKAIVADGARAYIGSVNLSWTSMTKNREIGLVATDAPSVAVVAGTIDADWKLAKPFP
jgi:phosphatidylserine/phosphatidylglycerophosphate/cardiolipin synthase-like enzyme